eukprot:COSAG03_NODE_91_length_13404_cov_69.155205_3_plen_176_part_00
MSSRTSAAAMVSCPPPPPGMIRNPPCAWFLATVFEPASLCGVAVLTHTLHNVNAACGVLDQPTTPELGSLSTPITRTPASATSSRGLSSPTSAPASASASSTPFPTMTMTACGCLARLPIDATGTVVRALVPRAQGARRARAFSHGGRASRYLRSSTRPLPSPQARRICLTPITR